ncbi:TA2R9 protein, partial [Oenanthe oenanthe]|nr:TA2R9 protein [Oenanthe oenanthe]
QSNVTSSGAIILAIISLEAFAGMWINAFIICLLCTCWVKEKTLNSNEKILLLLGCSRFCSLCSSWIYGFLSNIYPNCLLVYSIFQILGGAYSFSNCSSLFVSACLCGFYCIKIANFRNSFFNYLKVKIDRMVPWLLLGSVIFSLIIGILIYNTLDEAVCKNLNFTCQGSLWKATISLEEHFYALFFVTGVLYTTSLMAVIFSAVFLLFSLWRHKHKMQTNSMNSPSMEAHIRAMKSVLSFLVMYSINFVCLVLTITYIMMNENNMIVLISIYLYAYPGIHSLILILSNPKLEKKLLRFPSCMKYKICMR